MKIELGKTYRRRDGKVILIDKPWPTNKEFPFIDSMNDNGYRPDGTHGGPHDQDWDIVEEVESEAMTIPKAVFEQLIEDRNHYRTNMMDEYQSKRSFENTVRSFIWGMKNQPEKVPGSIFAMVDKVYPHHDNGWRSELKTFLREKLR